MNSASMTSNVELSISNIEQRLKKAQFALDTQIMQDMKPLMPMQTGNFIQSTSLRSAAYAGTGTVVAAVPPMGRFLYYGKLMIYPPTGSPWAPKDGKKVVTDRDLVLNRGANPMATARWFEHAKMAHHEEWLRLVASIVSEDE